MLEKEGIDYNKLKLIICPELIAAAIKKNEEDLYITWLVLRSIDRTNENSGHLNTLDIQGVMMKFLGVKQSQLYSKLQSGIGKYWAKPNGTRGERTTSLLSRSRVICYLEPTMVQVKPFKIILQDLLIDNLAYQKQHIHDLLICFVVGSREDFHPLSYASISGHTGLSKRTIQRAINSCGDISKYYNALEYYENPNYDLVREKMYELINANNGMNPWRIVKKDNTYKLVKQIPNSFILSFDRTSVVCRPKELKYFDKINVNNRSVKKYYDKQPKEKTDNEKYVSTGYVKEEYNAIFTWKIMQNIPQLTV